MYGFLPWLLSILDWTKCLVCFGITIYWAWFIAKARDEGWEWWEPREERNASEDYLQATAWRR